MEEIKHPCERCEQLTPESDLHYVTTNSGGEEHEWFMCARCKKLSELAKRVWESRKLRAAQRAA